MINWFVIVITLVGGLAIFLYGMNLMSEGVNKSAGAQIRNLLQAFTSNRFTALLTGTIATSVVQSSSAVSVMVISIVKAGLLKFPQTFGILLGAGIGTTITAQIIAFKIADYALLIIALGFFVNILSSKQILKLIGSAILGFGLLFYGLHLMSEAMKPLRDYQPFLDFLVKLEKPWAGVLAGFIFTAIIQSSSAFIGIIIVLASQNLLSIDSGIALLLGSNIGTTITAAIASLSAGYESKRVALAFFLIKLIGALIFIAWIPVYAKWVIKLSSGISGIQDIPLSRLIANAHTFFNILVTILLLPFANIFSKWVMKMIPEKTKPVKNPVEVKFIEDKMITSPALALSLAQKEVVRMGQYVLVMITYIIEPFIAKKGGLLKEIEELEEKVDFLRKKIAAYLTEISQQQLKQQLAEENFKILYINTELEEIADIVSNILAIKANQWLSTENDFSDEGKQEILQFHGQTVDHFKITLQIIDTLDHRKATKLKKQHKEIRKAADEFKHKHFERLSHNVSESVNTSKLHMDLIGALRMIHSHIDNITRQIIKNSGS